jgi:exonuclease III
MRKSNTIIVSHGSKQIIENLNWNLRGINSEKKCLALASKIDESNCDIIFLQETKGD